RRRGRTGHVSRPAGWTRRGRRRAAGRRRRRGRPRRRRGWPPGRRRGGSCGRLEAGTGGRVPAEGLDVDVVELEAGAASGPGHPGPALPILVVPSVGSADVVYAGRTPWAGAGPVALEDAGAEVAVAE